MREAIFTVRERHVDDLSAPSYKCACVPTAGAGSDFVKEGPNRSPVWTILDDETVFEAKPFVRVTRQRVITCQGKEVPDYYQVGLPDFVLVWAPYPI